MTEESRCKNCHHHPTHDRARKYCTHYMIGFGGTCTRDFDLFPIGWSVDSLKNFTGIEKKDDHFLYGHGVPTRITHIGVTDYIENGTE